MVNMNTEKIISDDVLVRNVDLYKNGDMEDKKCPECNLSSILHPNPKKHHCDLVGFKKDSDSEWLNVKLDLMDRMNKTILESSMNTKEVKETDVNKLLVNNLTLLAEKVEKIATVS